MLHDFLLFEKRTGKVVGHFRTTTPDLLPEPPSPELSQVAVTEDAHKELLRGRTRSQRLVGNVHGDKVAALKVEARFRGKLILGCDAKDLDKDGHPELAADGKSSTQLSARLVDGSNSSLSGESIEIRFDVTRGTLSSRLAPVQHGVAAVTLTSSIETVVTTVSARAEGFEPATLTLEFIPRQEFDLLTKQASKGR